MGKKILRAIFAIIAGGVSYVVGVALWFLTYNWKIFTQFVRDLNVEVAITLIIPGVFAGILIAILWPKRKS